IDAVGADQHVAAPAGPVRSVPIEEVGRDAALVLAEGAQAMAGLDMRFAQARPHRLVDHRLQAAAMDGELRHVVAGIDAARLAPDLLAEAVGVDELVGADGDLVEARQQAEFGKLLDGMRQRVDADAEFAHRVRLLENLAVDAARVQHEGRSQPADSAANDDRLHVRNPRPHRRQGSDASVPLAGLARNAGSAGGLAAAGHRVRRPGGRGPSRNSGGFDPHGSPMRTFHPAPLIAAALVASLLTGCGESRMAGSLLYMTPNKFDQFD